MLLLFQPSSLLGELGLIFRTFISVQQNLCILVVDDLNPLSDLIFYFSVCLSIYYMGIHLEISDFVLENVVVFAEHPYFDPVFDAVLDNQRVSHVVDVLNANYSQDLQVHEVVKNNVQSLFFLISEVIA